MERLIAQDLVLLCWDTEKGRPRRSCSSALPAGVGGALLLDAVLAEQVTIDDGTVRPTGVEADDGLIGAVVAEAARPRRSRKVKRLVERLGTGRRLAQVRDRLVEDGVLRRERRRALRVFPITRYPAADPGAPHAVRETVRSLLTGRSDPTAADPRDVLLAALAKPTNAISGLVERPERKAAERRAEAFGEGHGVPAAVGRVIKDAQAATVAAVGAVAATSASSSGSS